MKLFILLFYFSLLNAQTLTLVKLPNQSKNFCNDGTRAGYYWKSWSKASLSNHYLIFLQSGAWCWDQASCASRWSSSPNLMSSSSWPTTVTKNFGIFSSADWSGANLVYVNYCSSDGWVGNQTKSTSNPNTFGWYFNGKNIVTEVFNQLLTVRSMTLATHVLFAGCSAGGRGVIGNLDYIYNYIKPRILTPNVVIKGFADSAWWLLDFPNYPGTTPVTLVQQAKALYSMASARPNDACAAAYGSGDRWQCGFAGAAWNFIKTPIAHNIFLFDQYQLNIDSNGVFPWVNSPTLDAGMTEYALRFDDTTQYVLQAPIESINVNNYGIFASACYSHCSTESSNYYNVLVNGQNLNQTISNWFFKNIGFAFIDTCTTFKCGVGCPN